jgi:hypothetical protein
MVSQRSTSTGWNVAAGGVARIGVDNQDALGAGFADVTALYVAAVDDVRSGRHDLSLVDMAEGPVVVVFAAEIV